jgi:hypothetical protein
VSGRFWDDFFVSSPDRRGSAKDPAALQLDLTEARFPPG